MKTAVLILFGALLFGAVLSVDNLPRGRVTIRNVAGLEGAGLLDRAAAAGALLLAEQDIHDFLIMRVVVLRWGRDTSALAIAWPYSRAYRVYNTNPEP